MGLWEKTKQAAMALALAGSVSYLGWMSIGKPVVAGRTPENRQLAERVRKEHPEIALEYSVTSPDGSRILFTGIKNAEQQSDLYMYDADKKALENITNSAISEYLPGWIDNNRFTYHTFTSGGLSGWHWKNIRTGSSGTVPSRTAIACAGMAGMFGIPLVAILGLAILRKKRGRPLLEPVIYDPWATAKASFLGYTGAFAFLDSFASAYPDIVENSRFIRLAAAAAIPFCYTTLVNGLAGVKPPYVRNRVKGMWLSVSSLFRGYEGTKKCLEQVQKIIPNPGTMDLELGKLDIAHGNIVEGLLKFKKGLESIADHQRFKDMHDSWMRLAWRKFYFSRRKETPEKYLTLSTLDLGRCDFSGVIDALEKFVVQQPDTNRKAARALYVQSIADNWPAFQKIAPGKTAAFEQQFSLKQLTDEYWKQAIDAVLADPLREQQFRKMGESRNEVLEYAPNEFLKGLLVFKRCDAKEGGRLRNERENILELRKQFDKRIVQSLNYVEHEGKAYHVLQHGTSRTLEKVLKEGTSYERVQAWKQAAQFLSEYQCAALPGAESALPHNYYSKRLVDVAFGQLSARRSQISLPHGLRNELERVGSRLGRELSRAPIGLYKDANWRNWLVEDKGSVVAIDFEHRSLMPVQLDAVSLFESGEARKEERDDALNAYLGAYGERKPLYRDRFLREYKYAALQRHLELAGYRARDQEYGAVQFHVQHAQASAFAIGENVLAKQLGRISVTTAAASAGR